MTWREERLEGTKEVNKMTRIRQIWTALTLAVLGVFLSAVGASAQTDPGLGAVDDFKDKGVLYVAAIVTLMIAVAGGSIAFGWIRKARRAASS